MLLDTNIISEVMRAVPNQLGAKLPNPLQSVGKL
jgi:predicted nucleic acid-binding protein